MGDWGFVCLLESLGICQHKFEYLSLQAFFELTLIIVFPLSSLANL